MYMLSKNTSNSASKVDAKFHDGILFPAEMKSNDFGPFLEIISRIRFEFCRRGN